MNTARRAFIKTIPVLAGYMVIGFGFGVLFKAKGYGPLWAAAMSISVYAGSMQYVAIDLISGGATLAASAIMTLMVNARHLFYGIAMVEKYRDTGAAKPYLIFGLTDETYSLLCLEDPERVDKKTYYFLVTLFNQLYWIAGSVIGGLAAQIISFDSRGVEFSMTALFLVTFIEQWRGAKEHFSALTGVIASVICLVIFGTDSFLIPSMIAILVILAVSRRRLDRGASDPKEDKTAEESFKVLVEEETAPKESVPTEILQTTEMKPEAEGGECHV